MEFDANGSRAEGFRQQCQSALFGAQLPGTGFRLPKNRRRGQKAIQLKIYSGMWLCDKVDKHKAINLARHTIGGGNRQEKKKKAGFWYNPSSFDCDLK